MPNIIDGIQISNKIKDVVKKSIQEMPEKPRLAVIQVGANEASSVYVRNKLKACNDCGIETISAHLDSSTTLSSLLGLIDGFNKSPAFSGILVQLPLPAHIQASEVLEAIDPIKDVDGFHPVNVGRLTVRSSLPYLHPCTPWGIVYALDTVFPKIDNHSGLRGKRAVVIGQSHIVGRPLSVMLQNEGATVSMVDKFTPRIIDYMEGTDIIVSATGVHGIIDEKEVLATKNPNVVLIDAGIAVIDGKIVGDMSQAAYMASHSYTPVPKGVGPITIAFLIRNVLKAHCMQKSYVIPSFH